MIKLVYCVRKRKDMSSEDFHSYWRNKHSANVNSVKEKIGAVRYVQSHTCEPEINAALVASRGLAPAYDGITEVWWESGAALTSAMATAEGEKAMQFLIDDESTFIDFSESRVFMTEEHDIF